MQFQTETVTLQSTAGSEVVVAPQWGGGVCRWHCRGRELLRPAPAAVTEPFRLASFPLVPFSNRIGNGRFVSVNRSVHLPPNWAGHPHTIHGYGWISAWQVTTRDRCSVSMQLDYVPGPWPWKFRATQLIRLGDESLELLLELKNLDSTAMPAGAGQHPYFPRPPGTRLRAHAESVWLTDELGLPVRCIDVPESWRFAGETVLDGLALDNVFPGWAHSAMLQWPDGAGLLLTASEAADFLVVYSPPDHPLVCLEPVTHMTDAVNRPEPADVTGLRLLEPGDALSLSVRMEFYDAPIRRLR